MPILIECPSCRRQLRVQDELVGKRVKCPSCGTAFPAASVGGPQGASRTPAPPPPSPLDAPPPPPPPEEVEYRGDEGGDYPDDDRRRRARKKKRRAGDRVKIPAIFMMIVAILGLISTLIATILTIAGAGVMTAVVDDPNFQRGFNQRQQQQQPFGPNRPGLGQNPRGPDPEVLNKLKNTMAGAGVVAVVIGILGVLLQGLMLFGSIQMLRLKTYGLAVTAAILCMISGLCASFGTVSLALSASVATMGVGAVPSMCCCAGGLIFLPIDLGVGIWSLVVLMSADVKAAFG